ncbi:hypothetical protein Tco_0349943, partial [Tanacetum coccineum]
MSFSKCSDSSAVCYMKPIDSLKHFMDVEDIAAENVTAENPKRQRKKRPAVADASGSSHPPKKL